MTGREYDCIDLQQGITQRRKTKVDVSIKTYGRHQPSTSVDAPSDENVALCQEVSRNGRNPPQETLDTGWTRVELVPNSLERRDTYKIGSITVLSTVTSSPF